MRNRLWILFHLGTVAVLVLLTMANVASWLRPFSRGEMPADGASVNLASTGGADRSPAAVDAANVAANSKAALKTAQVGCETNVRLRVFDSVRQVRLQFDTCKDDVTGALNTTNGFEATVFGTAMSRAAQADAETEPAAGTFTAPVEKTAANAKATKRGVASVDSKSKKNARLNAPMVSTDYISLAPGVNQIKIVRDGREQVLSIERK